MTVIFEAIINYKWWLLLTFEILAWTSTFLMLYARYFMESDRVFKIATILVVVTGIVPHISLAILDIVQEGKINAFPIVIVALIIYGLTFGKKAVQNLDRAVKRWADNKKGKTRI